MVLMNDNARLVAYVIKQGTVFRVMCDLAQEILTWTEQMVIHLTAKCHLQVYEHLFHRYLVAAQELV